MFTTNARQRHPAPRFHKIVASAACAAMVGLISAGMTQPVTAEDRVKRPPYDRRVLSEIARDVLRRGATGPIQSVPTQTSPAPEPESEMTSTEAAPDGPLPATPIGPPRETVAVPIPPGADAASAVNPETAAAGYQSNSWRQGPHEARGLGFASSVLPPASGLDPALADQAHDLH